MKGNWKNIGRNMKENLMILIISRRWKKLWDLLKLRPRNLIIVWAKTACVKKLWLVLVMIGKIWLSLTEKKWKSRSRSYNQIFSCCANKKKKKFREGWNKPIYLNSQLTKTFQISSSVVILKMMDLIWMSLSWSHLQVVV